MLEFEKTQQPHTAYNTSAMAIEHSRNMETRDHSNGVSPKHQRRRGKLFRKMFCLLFALGITSIMFSQTLNPKDSVIKYQEELEYLLDVPILDSTNYVVPEPVFRDSIVRTGGSTRSIMIPITHFKQNGSWGGTALGFCSGTISAKGCALACMSMLLSAKGITADPGILNTWLKNNCGYQNSKGNCGDCLIVWGTGASYGNSGIEFKGRSGYNIYKIKEQIDAGNPVIVHGKGSGNCSHFVIVYGYNNSGASASDFIVSDPAGSNTGTLNNYTTCSCSADCTPMRIFNKVAGQMVTPDKPEIAWTTSTGQEYVYGDNLNISWQPVSGASRYCLIIKQLAGAPNPSSSENGYNLKSPYNQDWVYNSTSTGVYINGTSITLTPSTYQELMYLTVGKWVKIYVQAQYANGTSISEAHSYFLIKPKVPLLNNTLSSVTAGQTLNLSWVGTNASEVRYSCFLKELTNGLPDDATDLENEPGNALGNTTNQISTSWSFTLPSNLVAGRYLKIWVSANANSAGSAEAYYIPINAVVGTCQSVPNYDFSITPATNWNTSSSSILAQGCKMYSFYATQGERYTFKTGCGDGATANFDTQLYLYNSSGTQVTYNDDGCESGRDKIEDWQCQTSGYYYLRVKGYLSNYGNYTLAYRRTPPQYKIDCFSSPSGGGTTSGCGTFNSGATCCVTATPNSGYAFSHWSENGNLVSPSSPHCFAVNSDKNLVAIFTPNCPTPPNYNFTLDIPTFSWKTHSGSIASGGCYVYRVSVIAGQKYTFKTGCGDDATANFDTELYLYNSSGNLLKDNDDACGSFQSRIENWQFDYTGFAYVLVKGYMSSYGNYTLAYRMTPTYTISLGVNPSGGGTAIENGVYFEGEVCTVCATANSGYTFTNWTENGNPVSTNPCYSFTVTGNRNLVANFTAIPTYTITVSLNLPGSGTITGTGNYLSGSFCSLAATPNPGYAFSHWAENSMNYGQNPYGFTVTGNRSFIAYFVDIRPDNDLCDDAIPLSCSETKSGTLTGATPTTSVTYPDNFNKNDVFYKFTTTTAGAYTIVLTKSNLSDDIDLGLYPSCTATNALVKLTNNNLTETMTYNYCTANTTYYVRVIDWSGTGGDFDITLVCGWPIGTPNILDVIATLNGNTLTFSGFNNTQNFSEDSPPWRYLLPPNTTLTIGQNVASVGANAFRNCENLTSVNFSNSVTTIGETFAKHLLRPLQNTYCV